jgi:hypothetical protein
MSIVQDFKAFSAKYLRLKNKQAQVVPFILNPAQEKVHRIYEAARKEGKRLRFIILKARQEGVSTYFQGRIFHRCSTRFDRKAITVAHEQKAANNLLDMISRFYDNLPEALQPEIEHSNEKKLSYAALRSEMRIASADIGGALSRSDTVQDVHVTEVAFWRDPKSALLALLQTVPDDGDTLVVIESTANGIGGEFYDRWQDAKSGASEYIPIFIAWWEFPEYSSPFPSEASKDVFAASVTDEEISLGKIYSLTLEQLHWRRNAIANKCGGDADLFKQEYPSNDVEAFLTSGRPVFIQQICHEAFEASAPPDKIGYLEYTSEKKDAVKFIEDRKGYIRLYGYEPPFPPEVNRFASGWDIAEGLEQGDYTHGEYLDRKRNKVVLTWHGHIDPDKAGEEQHKIELFLSKKVYTCTERNNHGLTTIVEAQRLGVAQYYESDFQKGYEVATDKLGFKTTLLSKPLVINGLAEAIRDKSIGFPEKEFWGECLTFVRNSHGQMQAQNKDKDPSVKCFDDRVMAAAIMLHCHSWMPVYEAIDKPRTLGIDYHDGKPTTEKEWKVGML